MALPCCSNVEIPRKQNITENAFNKDYLNKGQPVIIEGAIEDWPARQWTLDSLVQKVGDNTVHVRHNTNCEDYKLGRKYDIRQTTFREYIDDLLACNKKARNSYLAVQNIRKAFPQLQDEVRVPGYIGKLHGGPYLWIACQGHYEYSHIDPDDGLLVMLQGCKNVRLFGCDMDPLYPNPKGTKGRTVQSQVDCDHPDLQKHPLFRGATCHHCQLRPGDMLYIPAFWWHQVTSVETSVSINMFWGDAGTNTYLTKVMSPPVWPAFRHWLLNVVQQNRDCPSFPHTLSRLSEALYNFLKNQWYEEATAEQLTALVQVIMEYLGIDELPHEPSSGKHPPPLQIRGLLWRS